MNIGAKTDKGKTREQNEDAFGYRDTLFVVADGMGGHQAGEIASAIAVETVLATEIGADPVASIQEAVLKANNAILDEMAKNENFMGMGTTIAILLLGNKQAYVSHMGDSRIYQMSAVNGNLRQLTDDHSFVAELIKNGSITEAEAKIHPQRNVLTRALGTPGKLEFEVNAFSVSPGDKFLLCSDGLTGMVDENTIKEILSSAARPQTIAEKLVGQANDNGGTDNITVIIIEI
ncbi:MAG TPA: Stp1/IreP family PP2C-type Ser/Thr phosphatase [Firmicutes bacterium]|jgi:PPM family protein phosphatase|nr:Stp1/IreP family PP2C-type Ser/Thr phosphatase [Bacillota bacterium]